MSSEGSWGELTWEERLPVSTVRLVRGGSVKRLLEATVYAGAIRDGRTLRCPPPL